MDYKTCISLGSKELVQVGESPPKNLVHHGEGVGLKVFLGRWESVRRNRGSRLRI